MANEEMRSAFYVWNLAILDLNCYCNLTKPLRRELIMTLNIELPETLITQFHARQISENDIKK
jgi:hypothetical protein